MKHKKWTFKESYEHVFQARGVIFPNDGFYEQLRQFEQELFGISTMEPRTSRWGHQENVQSKPSEIKKEKEHTKRCWVQ
jgi:hypothetical protein